MSRVIREVKHDVHGKRLKDKIKFAFCQNTEKLDLIEAPFFSVN